MRILTLDEALLLLLLFIIADFLIVYLLVYRSGIWILNCGSSTKIQIYFHFRNTIKAPTFYHWFGMTSTFHQFTQNDYPNPTGRWGHFLSHYIRHLHIIAMLSDIVVHFQVISYVNFQVRHLHLFPVQNRSLHHMYFANNSDKYENKSFHCVDSYNLKKSKRKQKQKETWWIGIKLIIYT